MLRHKLFLFNAARDNKNRAPVHNTGQELSRPGMKLLINPSKKGWLVGKPDVINVKRPDFPGPTISHIDSLRYNNSISTSGFSLPITAILKPVFYMLKKSRDVTLDRIDPIIRKTNKNLNMGLISLCEPRVISLKKTDCDAHYMLRHSPSSSTAEAEKWYDAALFFNKIDARQNTYVSALSFSMFLGMKIWWVMMPEIGVILPHLIFAPDWLILIKETFIDGVCSQLVPGDACECSPVAIHRCIALEVKNAQDAFDPLGLGDIHNQSRVFSKLLVGAFVAIYLLTDAAILNAVMEHT